MRPRVWSVSFIAALVLTTAASSLAQETKRIDIEPGKFVALRGYVVQEDSLICRTPAEERQLALTLNAALAATDELRTLRQIAERHDEEIQLYKQIIARKDFVVQKQDSLIQELEGLLRPQRPSWLRKLGSVFDRRTFFVIGFALGVYAGVNVPAR